jgi:hypothetical protein
MGLLSMTDLDWKSRHPFSTGQTVFAREQAALDSFGLFLSPAAPYVVRMIGEDAYGLWVAVVGVVEHLLIRLFGDAPPAVCPPATPQHEVA